MSTQPSPGFGSLLRQYRRTAGLTQEELAERAGLGRATIDALERGTRQTPRKETVALLADALALKEDERVLLEAAAREHRRDLQPGFTPFSAAAPLAIIPAAESGAPAEAAPARVLRLPGKRIARLLRSKRVAGLVSGLLVVVLLGSVLFFTVASGRLQAGGRTLCLATDLPTSGVDTKWGKPVENAANLAVMQHQNLGSGYTLKVINYNDEAATKDGDDPQHGAQNLTDMVRNPCIVGMVGPFNSDAAVKEMPIAANAGLVVISPANTAPGLTLRPYAEAQGLNFDQLHPPGKPINYFRISPTDATQFVADAGVTFNLGARSAYMVNEPSPYGELLVSGFTQTFEGKGGRIVGIDTILPNNPALIPQVAARIVAAHPDAVFYGGITAEVSGPLKAQLVNLGYRGFFVSGDAIANNTDFVAQAGVKAANGTYASVGVRDTSTFTSGAAATFIRDYAARYPIQDLNPLAANAYDAAMVLITACENLIRAGKAVTRAALIEQVQHIEYAGVTGSISFDANGDIAHGVFSIYTVQDGQWVYAWQVSV